MATRHDGKAEPTCSEETCHCIILVGQTRARDVTHSYILVEDYLKYLVERKECRLAGPWSVQSSSPFVQQGASSIIGPHTFSVTFSFNQCPCFTSPLITKTSLVTIVQIKMAPHVSRFSSPSGPGSEP